MDQVHAVSQPVRFLLIAAIASVCGLGCSPESAESAKTSTEQGREDEPSSPAETFELVSGNEALAPIVLPVNATPRNREAAEELVDAIQQISGAKVEIIEASPANPPERAIWIGLQPGIEGLFPGADLNLTQPEEIRIVTRGNHLLIAGRDRFDPDNLSIEGQAGPIEGKQWEYGTANAVYTFLQEFLGVRWLLPGPLGADFPESSTVTIPPTDLRYHPQFRVRMGIFAPHDEERSKGVGVVADWARRQRLLLDSLDISGGHAFTEWWDEYGETRPELFALQPDGTRGTYPASARTKKVCEGEPAVWDLWLQEVSESIEKNPMQSVFNASANDGWSSGHCVDPRSQAWDPPVVEGVDIVPYDYSGPVTLERPPISDRYITFANKLSEMLKARYPDEEYFVTQMAYGGTGRAAPVSAIPSDNVIVVSVNNFLFRGKVERAEQMGYFDDWSKIADKIIWRPNMGGSSGWHWGTPDVGFSRAAHDMKWVAERGTMGIFIDMVWDHWGTQGPLYYLMAQLAWDPYADPDEILKDFCDHAYGPASATMLTYWRLMEDKRNEIEDASPTRWRMLDSPKFYTAEFFDVARKLLALAAVETANAPGKFAQRVALVQAGFYYTELVIDTRAAMQRWELSKGSDTEAESRVLANWAKTDAMKNSAPEFAISWVRAMRNDVPAAKQSRRMYGLHPELVLTGSKLREYLAGETAANDARE